MKFIIKFLLLFLIFIPIVLSKSRFYQLLPTEESVDNFTEAIEAVLGKVLAEKYKSESIHYQKGTQAESMRNNDLAKALNQAENTHRLRVNQVDEGNK